MDDQIKILRKKIESINIEEGQIGEQKLILYEVVNIFKNEVEYFEQLSLTNKNLENEFKATLLYKEKLEEEHQKLINKIKKMQDHLYDADVTINNNEKQIKDINEKNNLLKISNEELRSEIKFLYNINYKLESNINIINEQNEMYTNQNNSISDENLNLDEKLKETCDKLRKVREENKVIYEQLLEQQINLNKINEEKKLLETQNIDLTNSIFINKKITYDSSTCKSLKEQLLPTKNVGTVTEQEIKKIKYCCFL
jgi:chromosome segregation ATPase